MSKKGNLCYDIVGDLYMNNFTFLTDEQIFGSNQLDIIRKYGTACAITDFSILLGGFVSSYYTSEGKTGKDRTGWWWTKSSDGDNDARAVDYCGDRYCTYVSRRAGGARPALPYSAISSISSNEVRGANGCKEVEYGEYPQTIVDEKSSSLLEGFYNSGNLRITGKQYTTDSENSQSVEIYFKARKHIEYAYNGSKYIRFVADMNADGSTLSDGRTVQSGYVYWVKVEPISWLIDEMANIALCKKIIFSGVQFKHIRDYDGDFDRTDIKQFMDTCFAKEIVSSQTYLQGAMDQEESLLSKQKSRKENPYGFQFDNVSEEDIIRGAIESNVSVFLHGRSSEGKSARVKQLDPDCEIIYMRNATPNSLNGKSVYNAETGEMIDVAPTWYLKVKEKCEREPNKIHIIFFDELTNALPSIQGMAFNIVLDGEVDGKWKLPDNARIVAAGNDLNDSLAANQMAEPLFNRFAHVYIQTTVDSWLKWASTPKGKYERLDYKEEELELPIHPAIYAYVAYKSYSGSDVLRTPYTGDQPNADPRKWEMASKVLYKTKKPEMLRALIGEKLTRDFIAFVSFQVLCVEDVIQHNYSEGDLEMNVSQKFATAVGLSSVDDEHFEIIRDFMKKLGAEPRAVFESMWAHGDEARMERLLEIKMSENNTQGGIRK